MPNFFKENPQSLSLYLKKYCRIWTLSQNPNEIFCPVPLRKVNKEEYIWRGGDTDIWGMLYLLYVEVQDCWSEANTVVWTACFHLLCGGWWDVLVHIYTNKGMSVQEVGYGWGPAQVNRVSFSPPLILLPTSHLSLLIYRIRFLNFSPTYLST